MVNTFSHEGSGHGECRGENEMETHKHLWTLAHGMYDVKWSHDEDLFRVCLTVRRAVDVETVNDSLTVDARRSREDGQTGQRVW